MDAVSQFTWGRRQIVTRAWRKRCHPRGTGLERHCGIALPEIQLPDGLAPRGQPRADRPQSEECRNPGAAGGCGRQGEGLSGTREQSEVDGARQCAGGGTVDQMPSIDPAPHSACLAPMY